MKTMTIRQNFRPTYPNAADRRYHLRKLLDGLLTVAMSVGTVAAILFLLML